VNAVDEGAAGWFAGSVITGLASLALLGLTIHKSYLAARVVVAPEAAFILDHIAKLAGTK
jgi:hypothetical protein